MTHVVPWWSPSRLACYDQCPAEYHRRYVLREKAEPNTPMFFGTAVHKGLEAHFGGGNGDLAFRREWRKLIAELAAAGLRAGDLVSVGLELIEKVVAMGLTGIPEKKIWVRCEDYLNAPMLGYVDLWSPSNHTIYDFKTTIGSWSEARAESEQWQPCIYSWVYFMETGELPAFEYIVMHRGTGNITRFKTSRTIDQISDMLTKARGIAVAVAAEQWDCRCGKHGEAAA